MKLTDVQGSAYNYLRGNQIGVLMLQFSKLLLLAFPCFLLISEIDFLDPIEDIFVYFREILYFCYFAGIVACFAKNEMIFGALAFGIRAVVKLIGFIQILDSANNYALYNYLNYIIGMLAYGFLAYICFALSQKKAN